MAVDKNVHENEEKTLQVSKDLLSYCLHTLNFIFFASPSLFHTEVQI